MPLSIVQKDISILSTGNIYFGHCFHLKDTSWAFIRKFYPASAQLVDAEKDRDRPTLSGTRRLSQELWQTQK